MIKPSSRATLRKYGMTIQLWYSMLSKQNNKCLVCGEDFTPERRPVLDHEHVRGYKNMSQEKKILYVRGMLHNYCNRRLVAKGMTTKKAYNIYKYLSEYDKRKPNGKEHN